MSARTGAIAAAALAVLLLVLLPLALHLGLRAHSDFELLLGDDPGPPGNALALALALVIDHELDGTTGWRPNDLVIWGPAAADNNSNRQLGILQGLRETVRVFKDHLTKVSSENYDDNLVEADNLLRNDPTKWMLPSAESRYRDAAGALRSYAAGLSGEPARSRPINVRTIELMRLVQAWTDLLGAAHADLYRDDIGFFETDDVYYRATGRCHTLAYAVAAIEVDYRGELDRRPVLTQLLEEVRVPLQACARAKPLVVLAGHDTSLRANHLRNLDAHVVEARQKLYSVRDELEK